MNKSTKIIYPVYYFAKILSRSLTQSQSDWIAWNRQYLQRGRKWEREMSRLRDPIDGLSDTDLPDFSELRQKS